MSRRFFIVNLLGFQAVWFAAVIGAANGSPWAGPVAAGVFIAAHLAWTPDRSGDKRLLAAALPMGLAADSLLVATGLLVFASPWPSAFLAPVWILAMWAGFALTLNHSMAFLRDRPWLAAGFGAIGGPLAYLGASNAFGAVSFGHSAPLALLALGVIWGVALPVLYRLGCAQRTPSDGAGAPA